MTGDCHALPFGSVTVISALGLFAIIGAGVAMELSFFAD